MTAGIHQHPKVFESPVFRARGLSEHDKKLLMGLGFATKQYPPQHTIMHQGESEDRTFIVQSGWGCICKDLVDGERQIADLALPGDVIGMRVDKGDSHKSFVSLTDMVVFEARAKVVIRALGHSEKLAEVLFWAISRQRAILIEHMTNLGRRSAAVRTGHFLLEIRARLQAAGIDANRGYDCPLTQYDLADALGLTAIHVNRMLRELREQGFLSFRHGTVEFFDPEGLAAFCSFDPRYLA